ncbi:hypothetical protein ACLKMH_14965 [Psychromonas sp. KJ10-10]|uniref:hypothetical protein n=1 Tax=Psychromonas sp. KJ10-10 TaxID=3391823 RepID=UPI0039B6BD31
MSNEQNTNNNASTNTTIDEDSKLLYTEADITDENGLISEEIESDLELIDADILNEIEEIQARNRKCR